MKKLILGIIFIIILSISFSYAVYLNTEEEVFKDDTLPFSDLQVPVINERTGLQKEDRQGNLIFKYHKNVNEIIKASNKRLRFIDGYSDGTFRPDNDITRAEFIKLAVMLALNRNFDLGSMPKIIDHWASAYVAVAEMQRVIGNNQYSINDLNAPISRIEMICILSNIQIKMKGVPLYTDAMLPSYTDVGDLSEEEKALLLHACKYELLSDMFTVTEIKPHENLTRGEAARAIMRIY